VCLEQGLGWTGVQSVVSVLIIELFDVNKVIRDIVGRYQIDHVRGHKQPPATSAYVVSQHAPGMNAHMAVLNGTRVAAAHVSSFVRCVDIKNNNQICHGMHH
jgi:hypothetical protein